MVFAGGFGTRNMDEYTMENEPLKEDEEKDTKSYHLFWTSRLP